MLGEATGHDALRDPAARDEPDADREPHQHQGPGDARARLRAAAALARGHGDLRKAVGEAEDLGADHAEIPRRRKTTHLGRARKIVIRSRQATAWVPYSSAMTAKLLQRLRAFALSLPGTCEVPSWGHPNFRAGKKTFAVYELYRGRPCIAVKLPRPDGQVLLGDGRFFVTPYTGKHGWVSLWVDEPVAWPLVRDLVLRSYREVATRTLLAELEAGARSRKRGTGTERPSPRQQRGAARRTTRARAKSHR